MERKPPGPEDHFKTALRWARMGLHGRALAALDPTPLAQPTAGTVEAVTRAMVAQRTRVPPRWASPTRDEDMSPSRALP